MPRRRERLRLWALIVALTMSSSGVVAEEGRRRFLAERRCWIDSALKSTHASEPRASQDRFVIVSLTADPQSYVQCLFRDDDTRMLCEASSGAHRYRDGQGMRLDMARESVTALKALGFARPDPKGNFVQVIELGSPRTLEAVTTLMLTSLYDAYGADAASSLDWRAPRATIDYTRCAIAYGRAIRRR